MLCQIGLINEITPLSNPDGPFQFQHKRQHSINSLIDANLFKRPHAKFTATCRWDGSIKKRRIISQRCEGKDDADANFPK